MIPSISDYRVSPELGFLPSAPPLRCLPSSYRNWDSLASKISVLISSKTLRSRVKKLAVISTNHLENQEQLRRAFVVLGFLIHAYVWCDGSDHPEPNVPPQLGEPYLDVCHRLGMQPTLSYAGLCLWNWEVNGHHSDDAEKQVNGAEKIAPEHLKRIDDLNCLVSFTMTRDEAVFYLVPVMVEAEGGKLVGLLLDAMGEAGQAGSSEKIVEVLQQTKETLSKMGSLIKLLHEQCDSKIFYQEVRPFFPGGKGMEEKGMPDGVVFHRSDGTHVSAKCVGGSAAQSSYFQFIDSALGVKHNPVGDSGGETVFHEMWLYMPREHRTFLELVAKLPSLREYVGARPDDQKLNRTYNGCLQELASWRSRHIGVVTTHIVTPSRNEQREGRKPDPEEVTDGLSVQDESKLKGTGGSPLIPFLKQAKQETLDARSQ